MGIEPTRPAWKAGILAIELHPQTVTTVISTTDLEIISVLKPFVKAFSQKNWKICNYCVISSFSLSFESLFLLSQ